MTGAVGAQVALQFVIELLQSKSLEILSRVCSFLFTLKAPKGGLQCLSFGVHRGLCLACLEDCAWLALLVEVELKIITV